MKRTNVEALKYLKDTDMGMQQLKLLLHSQTISISYYKHFKPWVNVTAMEYIMV